jgi:predicted nucleic acid-binding protein
MILVDTSVWVDHFRSRNSGLVSWLEGDEVLTHPFVIGELACGHLRRRQEILGLLSALPSATVARHEDVLALVDAHRLFGRGIGWVDAHLLASALLSGVRMITLDGQLLKVAKGLGVAA